MLLIKKYISLFIKHTASLGLFVFLPLLLILYLGNNVLAIEREKHIASVSSRLENGLIDIESEIAPESFFFKSWQRGVV